jgi:deoxycytidine triphosphate deaminase
MTFEELSSPADVPYTKKKFAKYINQNSPLVSKITQDVKMKRT